MEITKIELQKNKLDRVNIYINNEFYAGMQNYVCVKNNLKVGRIVTEEEMAKYLKESDYEKAVNSAMKLLNRMPKTRKQVVDYLVKKDYSNQIVDSVMEKLTEYGYIDDNNYAKLYINTYKNKYGKRKIEFDLYKKGLSKSVVSSAMQDFETNKDELLTLAQKYMKNKESDLKTLQKLSSYLQYRGFSWDDINSVLKHFK